MRRVGIVMLAILLGCLQLSLRGLGHSAVTPNVMIILLIVLLNRWSFEDLALIAITIGIVLEIGSLAPVGTQIISCLLIVLIGKVVLRQATDVTQGGFLIALGLCVTIAYNLTLALTLPAAELLPSLRYIVTHTLIESVYNVVGIALGSYVFVVQRESAHEYRLPK